MTRLIMSMFAVALAMALSMAPAGARPLDDAHRAGVVGNQADGYLGIAGSAPPSVAQEVARINLERRDYYTRVARERGTSLEAVGAIFGQQLYAQTPSGELFRDASGNWITKP